MASTLRRILPTKPSIPPKVDDEYNLEYSFALEYSGPPVSYDIPQVVPVDVDRIPIAAVVSKTSKLNNLSLPVVQPIVKSDPLGKKLSKGSKLGLQAAESPIPATHSGEFDDAHLVNFSGSFGTSLKIVNVIDRHGTSFRVVNVIDNSGELEFSEGEKFMRRVLNGNESSGTLGFSDSHDYSHDLSGSSDMEGVVDGREEGVILDLEKPGLRTPGLTSEITCEEEESVHEARSPHHRTQVVTFRDPELSDIVHGENDLDGAIITQEKQGAKSNVEKGLCHRCLKGNRFTKKETCIVCSAKYCSNCVLRAMGSMPEGRKCITCIGYRIDESKRASLGKNSRMLKRLLTDIVAKQIMSYEISCEANQIPPELVSVNGKPLCHEELVQLLRCLNPPRKLKPRKYWYDKVSGLWGKVSVEPYVNYPSVPNYKITCLYKIRRQGERPCQIISPQLAVGDSIMQNASNGNTNILVNGREITKLERWVLKLAGINCAGETHFWMNADGSFQEEGQKNVTKQIWNKPRIKLACTVLSLPIPSESANSDVEEIDKVADKVIPGNLEQKTPCKLLMVGHDKSGTSTIFKQAKFIYKVPFSEYERQNIKSIIQSNLYCYLGILLEERERFEEEWLDEMRMKSIDQPGPSETQNSDQIGKTNIYSISPRLRAFSDWLLQVMMSGNLEVIFPAATREYAPLVEELWKDEAFQAIYNQRNEIQMLPRAANYFLDRAVEISRTDYEPSDMDILYAEGITSSNGIASVDFSFPKSVQDSFLEAADQNDPLQRYQLIRLHASSLGENCKWLEMFEDVDLIIYCVSLTDYDQFSYDINGNASNKMLESKKLFESIMNHPVCAEKDFLLILTKFDLLEEKIEHFPLTRCEWFHDFNPVISIHPNRNNNNNSNASLAQRAFHYIAAKFKEVFYSLTGNRLYVSRVTGLEADTVDEALKYGREILKWDYEKPNLTMNEWSSSSVEASTL